MKQIFTFLTVLILCSCGQQSEQTKVSADSIYTSDSSETNGKTVNKSVYN